MAGPRNETKYAARGGMTRDEVKTAVRRRDGYACVKCRLTDAEHREQYGRGLDVHRKTPGSLYTVAGCETLCRRCHGSEPKRLAGEPDHDTDTSGFLIRLPIEFKPLLEALQRKNHRPMTIELQRALIAYAKAEWVPCPDAPIFGRPRKS